MIDTDVPLYAGQDTGPSACSWPPGLEPRILRAHSGRETRGAYELAGGYASGRLGGESLVAEVAAAGLRGRGGAAFPSATKMRAVGERSGPRAVLANGAESEPMSVKDRWLMRNRPHLVIDGLLLAMGTVGAERGHLYVSDPESSSRLRSALQELDGCADGVELVEVDETYVAGEESAAVRAVEGKRPKPAFKPPRPFESGVNGWPTLVLNAETLAHLPFIASQGADAYRLRGTPESPGTTLVTISGACGRPGLYEVPFGVPLKEMIQATAGAPSTERGYVVGGFFGGLLGPDAGRLPFTHEALRAAGSSLGCGAVAVLGPEDCPIVAAADIMAFFARENARQCGSCMNGTAAMRDALLALARGQGSSATVAQLLRWSGTLGGRGACALLDGAVLLAGSLLREFSDLVTQHVSTPCPLCAVRLAEAATRTRFTVDL